jgi:L-methionine (R)-S-oxide reductase
MQKSFELHIKKVESLLRGDKKSALNSLVEYLRSNFRAYSWVGVYLLEGDTLVLNAWSGKKATEHTKIPIGMGLCGLAARTKQTVVVGDVSKDPRYLSCFPETKSEIVVPIIDSNEKVLGEIDIDSEELNAFDQSDKRFLEKVAEKLASFLSS